MNGNSDIGSGGIIAGGSWCVDHVKIIDAYPSLDSLGLILGTSRSNGGGPYNLLKDLAIMGAAFPLYGVGLLGNDEDGRFILDDCGAHGIDTRFMRTSDDHPTSYTEVMSEKASGRRSFFHHKGSNSFLGENHFDFEAVNAGLFHLAYINLLELLDEIGEGGETGAARVLRRARAAGLRTSVDLVSFPREDFAAIVRPSLPQVDILFLNELEASWLTGLDLAGDGPIDLVKARDALEMIQGMGVKKQVILHFPDAATALDEAGGFLIQGSVKVPAGAIAGAAGAGDAFAAGFLFGTHEGWETERCLELGVCVAASCLHDATTSGSIRPLAECLGLGEKLGYRSVE